MEVFGDDWNDWNCGFLVEEDDLGTEQGDEWCGGWQQRQTDPAVIEVVECSWTYERRRQQQHQYHGSAGLERQLHRQPKLEKTVAVKRKAHVIEYDDYSSPPASPTTSGVDSPLTITVNVGSKPMENRPKAPSPRGNGNDTELLQQQKTKKLKLNNTCQISWSTGDLHRDFLSSLFAQGFEILKTERSELVQVIHSKMASYRVRLSEQNIDLDNIIETVMASSEEELLHAFQREFECAKKDANYIVKPKSKLAKPVLQVYPISYLELGRSSEDVVRRVMQVVLGLIFDNALRQAKSKDIITFMGKFGHVVTTWEIKSHLQKYLIKCRPSQKLFWTYLK